MFCKKCGKEVNGKFCTHCGEKAENVPENVIKIPPAPIVKKKSRVPIVIAISVMVVIVGVLIGLIFGGVLTFGNGDSGKDGEPAVTSATSEGTASDTGESTETDGLADPEETESAETDPEDSEEAAAAKEIMKVVDALSGDSDPADGTGDLSEKKTSAEKKLDKLEDEGLITNVVYCDDTEMFEFNYPDGGTGYYALEKPEDDGRWSASPASGKGEAVPLAKYSVSGSSSASQKWLFLFYSDAADSDNYNYFHEQYEMYTELGINVEFKTNYTVSDFTKLAGYDLLYFMGHGGFYGGDSTPHIATDEVVTDANLKSYKGFRNNGQVKMITYANDPNSYYLICDSFFEYYQNEELNGAVVFNSHCGLMGIDGNTYSGFVDGYRNAGADAVFGFRNSVMNIYANPFYERVILYMLEGDTVGVAYEKAKSDLGSDEKTFYDKFAGKEVTENSFPCLYGNKTVSLFSKSDDIDEDLGELVVTFKDQITEEAVKDVPIVLADDKERLYRFYLTNDHGSFTAKIPEDNYVVSAEHEYYETCEVSCEVKSGVTTVILYDVLLERKNGTVTFTVVDSKTGDPVSGVTVTATFDEIDDPSLNGTAVSGENGVVRMELTYGEYTFTFTHDEYDEYTCGAALDSDNLVFRDNVELVKQDNYQKNYDMYTKYLTSGELDSMIDYRDKDYIEIESCMIDMNDDGTYELLLKLTNTEYMGPRGYEMMSYILGIKDDKVFRVSEVNYGGGTMGGEYYYINYDTVTKRHVVILDSLFRDGIYQSNHNIEAYSYDGSAISPYLTMYYRSLTLDKDFYDGEFIDKVTSEVKAETKLWVEADGYFYYYQKNDEYVSKEDYNSELERFTDPKTDDFEMQSGTYSSPLGVLKLN